VLSLSLLPPNFLFHFLYSIVSQNIVPQNTHLYIHTNASLSCTGFSCCPTIP
jgi:hypothetical protein